jgi:hypothetical protein
MNSPTITMERDSAAARLEEYEQAASKNPRAMHDLDRQIMAGYKALAQGHRLVDVNEAIKHGGMNLAGLPKLAIARAHVQECHWEATSIWRNTPGQNDWGLVPDGGGTFNYRSDRFPRVSDDRAIWKLSPATFDVARQSRKPVTAMLPLIPLPLRPRHDLSNYFLLWEANWFPAPPIDPYLLKPVCGSLMQIVAEWEVTPLELAAVRGGMR